jgi:Protein phosphatase 2C
MRTAVLRGRDHLLVGAVAAIAEGRAAIALSRGGARKQYAHKQPNEDAVAFAESEGAVLLAVADGHMGAEGAEVVIERLLAEHAPRWIGAGGAGLRARWVEESLDLLLDLNTRILALVASGASEGARTTLALAVASPGQDALAWLSMGDSHLFRVTAAEAHELGRADGPVAFLGWAAEDRASLPGKYRAGIEPLAGTRALVLASDGLSERGIGVDDPPRAAAEAVGAAACARPELRALEAARGLAERALEAQRSQGAGDNVATAVAWIA